MHYRLWMCYSSDFVAAAQRFETEAGVKALCYLWTKECILAHSPGLLGPGFIKSSKCFFCELAYLLNSNYGCLKMSLCQCVGLLFYYYQTWCLYSLLSAAVLLEGECLLRKHTTSIRLDSREAQAESTASSQPSAWQCWWQSLFPTERAAACLTIDMCRTVLLWKCFKGLSPYITIMQSEVCALITWTMQTSAEGGTVWKLCSCTT